MSISYEDIIQGSGAVLKPECSEKDPVISLFFVSFVKLFEKRGKTVREVEREIMGDLWGRNTSFLMRRSGITFSIIKKYIVASGKGDKLSVL
jgi:hypothetical protein